MRARLHVTPEHRLVQILSLVFLNLTDVFIEMPLTEAALEEAPALDIALQVPALRRPLFLVVIAS